MTPDEHAIKYPEVWRRFNPRQTLLRYTCYLVIVCLAVWSISNLDIPWFYFLFALVQAGYLITRMWLPARKVMAAPAMKAVPIRYELYSQAIGTPAGRASI